MTADWTPSMDVSGEAGAALDELLGYVRDKGDVLDDARVCLALTAARQEIRA